MAELDGTSRIQALVDRANAELYRGDFNAALTHALAAAAGPPNLLSCQVFAASIEGMVLGYDAALARLDGELSAGRESASLHRLRALALINLMRYDEALETLQRAAGLGPAGPVDLQLRAEALLGQNNLPQARAALDEAARADSRGSLRSSLANLQILAGDRDAARLSLRSALESNEADAFAWLHLSEISAFDDSGNDVATVERLLESPRSANEQMVLHFALGKAYLERSEHDRSFEHFSRGNALKKQMMRYDIAADEALMAELARAFPQAEIAQAQPGANQSERPVFVLGLPRSGTSLVEQLLASHPDVFGAGERLAMPQAAKLLWADLAAAPSLAQDYLDAVGRFAGNASRLVDKLPLNFLHIGVILRLFPNARIIHCRRDLVETGLSCFITLFATGNEFSYDLGDIGRYTVAYMRLMEHWRTCIPAGQFLEVDYEDVVADVETQARRLISFCGLPWNSAVLKFHENRRAVSTASRTQVRRPIYRTSVSRATAFGSALDPLRAALRPLRS